MTLSLQWKDAVILLVPGGDTYRRRVPAVDWPPGRCCVSFGLPQPLIVYSDATPWKFDVVVERLGRSAPRRGSRRSARRHASACQGRRSAEAAGRATP